MGKSRDRVQQIREYVLSNVAAHPRDIARITALHFGISRQSVAKHLKNLVNEGLLAGSGRTTARQYQLNPIVQVVYQLDVSPRLEEDVVWREKILSLMGDANDNVIRICNYGFTEMLNNVIEHSQAATGLVGFTRYATKIEIMVHDNGIGIFNKIQMELNLNDARHALLELSKGKLTTDQAKHTGEGIFFVSRMFDEFSILSGALYFSRSNRRISLPSSNSPFIDFLPDSLADDDNWLIEVEDREQTQGTTVLMEINPRAKQTMQVIFDKYASEEDGYGFTRTHVPIKLARYGEEQLVSRSQAKRVLARFDRFREVLLDFKDVPSIGQAFADEIFRVYKNEHPEVKIISLSTTPEIDRMIQRVTLEE